MIEVENVTVRYNGALALSEVSLRIEAQGLFAVLGRNGAGKTTLLRTLAGVLAPSSGRVIISGAEVHPPPSAIARRGLRFVPESGNVFGDLTVRDNLDGAIVREKRSEGRARVNWALDKFPILKPLLTRKASQLSGGERQSLAVAAALITHPKILLLDEPSLGLSPKMSGLLMNSIAAVAAESDMTVVLAEQNIVLAASLCKTGCWLETGKVVVSGTIDQVIDNLRSEVGIIEDKEPR